MEMRSPYRLWWTYNPVLATSWKIDGETVETVSDFIFLGFKITADGDCSHKMAAAAAKSLQSCLTLCDPIDGSPPAFLVPGILQARTLEWVAMAWGFQACGQHTVINH